MPDEVIRELWKIKDEIARQHGYDVERLVAQLRAKKRTEGERVADLRTMRKTSEQAAPLDASKPRP